MPGRLGKWGSQHEVSGPSSETRQCCGPNSTARGAGEVSRTTKT